MQVFLVENKILPNLEKAEKSSFYKFLSKVNNPNSDVTKTVTEIIENTKKNGDKALISFSNKFDKTSYKKSQDFIVSKKEFELAEKALGKDIKDALKTAYKRIVNYHKKQLPTDFYFTDETGVELGNSWRAVESIGVYVPGGSASYPSSVLMSAIPGIVAGVKEISICAPSTAGKINPAVLYAAKICGIEKVYKIGGAQAITALAFGSESIKKVNKIVGPGNSYVATAKKILFGEVGIDMIAGPTDVTIIADKNNNHNWIAADALSQLEHGVDSKAFIITDNLEFANKVLSSIFAMKEKLSRKEIIEKSLENSAIFVIKNLDEACHLVNFIAPEHLEMAIKNPKKILSKITNAGAIFLGNYTPEAIGDYIAGPSHTLPTSATAKFSSGLSVFDFLKRISIISCNKKAFDNLAKATMVLAESEGLTAHKLSVEIRKNK